MEDKLCLIPYSDIEFDKTFTNISEYFLRNNKAAEKFLSLNGAKENIAVGKCSDFELLAAFVKIIKDNRESDPAVVQAFRHVVTELCGDEKISLSDAEKIWTETSEALCRSKLRSMIFSQKVKKIGVPILPGDFFDDHFVSVKDVEFEPVFCPFGTDSVSFGAYLDDKCLSDVEGNITSGICEASSCAVFLNGFDFEKPNNYLATKAFEKQRAGQPLLNKEREVLVSQLLRRVSLSAAELDKELMVFLPLAPDLRSMGAAAELIKYIDGCLSDRRLRITVFGGDAVSLCMAESVASEKYKNITAVSGVCGNGSDVPSDIMLKHWGCDASSLNRYASLAPTPALLSGV